MRILLLSHLFPKASDRRHGIFVLRQAERLRSAGHDVEVVSPVPYIPQWLTVVPRWRRYRGQTAAIDVSGFVVHRPAYLRPPGAWFIAHEWRWMWLGIRATVRRLARQRPFDVVYAQDFRADAGAGVLAADELGVPCVGMAIGADLNEDVNISPGTRRAIVGALERCTAVVCNSEALCARVGELTGGRRSATRVTRGTDVRTFTPADAARKAALRAELGWAPESVVLLYAGYLKRGKGLEELFEAFERVAARHDEARLVLAGDGPLRDEVTARVARSAVRERIVLAGHVEHDEMVRYYHAADAIVMPSYSEGMPNTVVEGIACGLPILGTRVGGIPEAAPEGTVGVLCAPRDVAALGEGMERLVGDAALRARMGAAARAHAMGHFDAEKNTKRLCELLERVARGERI